MARPHPYRLPALVLAALLALAACGDSDDSVDDATTTTAAAGADSSSSDDAASADDGTDDDTGDTGDSGGAEDTEADGESDGVTGSAEDTDSDDGGGTLDDAALQAACDDLASELATVNEQGDALLEDEYGTNNPTPDTELGPRYQEVMEVFGRLVLAAGDVLDHVDDWQGADSIATELATAYDNHELVVAAFESFETDASESTTFGELLTVLDESGAGSEYGRPVIEAVSAAGIECNPF